MSAKENNGDGECFGEEFFLDRYWKFSVPSLGREFTSYDEMRDAIERSQKTLQSSKRRKLDISAVKKDGTKVHVSGVHAGHGKLITNPKSERYHRDELYFDFPILATICRELTLAEDRVRHIQAVLDRFQIPQYDNYGFDPGMHEGQVRTTEKAHADAKKLAPKTLDQLLESTTPLDD